MKNHDSEDFVAKFTANVRVKMINNRKLFCEFSPITYKISNMT